MGSSGHLKFDKNRRRRRRRDDGIVITTIITFKRIIFPTWSSTSWLLCLSFSHIVSFSSGLAHHDHYHLIPQTSSRLSCDFIVKFQLSFLYRSTCHFSLPQQALSSSDPRLFPHFPSSLCYNFPPLAQQHSRL